MGYLNLPKGIPGFNKAIISFWFRCPKASLDDLRKTAQAEFAKAGNDQFHTYPRMYRTLPLLTFGQLFEGYHLDVGFGGYGSYTHNVWSTPGTSWAIMTSRQESFYLGPVLVNKSPQPIDPSFIGVYYGGDNDPEEGGGSRYNLMVNVQTKDRGGSGLYKLNRPFSGDVNSGYPTGAAVDAVGYEDHWSNVWKTCISGAPAPGNPHVSGARQEDATDLWMGQLGPDSFTFTVDADVKPDTWHHILISFDLSKATSVTGSFATYDNGDCGAESSSRQDSSFSNPCRLWIAFDDENYADTSGLENAAGGYSFRENDWPSRYSRQAYFAGGGFNHYVAWGVTGVVENQTFDDGPSGNYMFGASALPSANQPFGIPAAANMVDKIYDVDMSEFQMWLGKTIDTGIENNRRYFLDYVRDEKGRPIVDKTGKKTLEPVDPEIAEQHLGRPHVLLHGTSDWEDGYNTGSLGLKRADENTNEPDQIIDSGQFKPFGTIIEFLPDPSIKKAAAA
jgi:hypothetical protein